MESFAPRARHAVVPGPGRVRDLGEDFRALAPASVEALVRWVVPVPGAAVTGRHANHLPGLYRLHALG